MSATPKLGLDDVLRAVWRAWAPFSRYILDELHRAHGEVIAAGGKGHPPTSAKTLRWLRQLERNGLLEASPKPYARDGYLWLIMPAGHRRLAQLREARS